MPPLPGPWGGRGMRGAAMEVRCPGAPAVSRCTMGRASPHQACAHTPPCHSVYARSGTAVLASAAAVERPPLGCHAWTARGVGRERGRESLTRSPCARGEPRGGA
jgi:hypothetical protein